MTKQDTERALRAVAGSVFFTLLGAIGVTEVSRDGNSFDFRALPAIMGQRGDDALASSPAAGSLQLFNHEFTGKSVPFPASREVLSQRRPLLERIAVTVTKIPGAVITERVKFASEEPAPKGPPGIPAAPTSLEIR